MESEHPFRLVVQWLDPKTLTPYENNAKEHPQEQIDDIAQQIRNFGFDQPILADEKREILKGHGRWLAALQEKMEFVPVIIREGLTEAEKIIVRNADNRVAQSPWNYTKLKLDFQSLQRLGGNLNLTGFKMPEFQVISQGWQSDFKLVDNTEKNLDGIDATIRILCPRELETEIRSKVTTTLEGIHGVSIK